METTLLRGNNILSLSGIISNILKIKIQSDGVYMVRFPCAIVGYERSFNSVLYLVLVLTAVLTERVNRLIPPYGTVSHTDFLSVVLVVTHHPVGPLTRRHVIQPQIDRILYINGRRSFIQVCDKVEIERHMSPGCLLAVVHHRVIYGRQEICVIIILDIWINHWFVFKCDVFYYEWQSVYTESIDADIQPKSNTVDAYKIGNVVTEISQGRFEYWGQPYSSNTCFIEIFIQLPFRSPTPSPLLSLNDLGYTW
ncbi:hypothetical protein AGLY_002831 [Aphis glycines]|uniref:Uncharacterized protein n=1 Tax=Aphis glycines TaxID=307491 RepID=A0A6G0U2B3_APHGL|nr:hypothetical protein AGLY_002831 [Aphis glycines]